MVSRHNIELVMSVERLQKKERSKYYPCGSCKRGRIVYELHIINGKM